MPRVRAKTHRVDAKTYFRSCYAPLLSTQQQSTHNASSSPLPKHRNSQACSSILSKAEMAWSAISFSTVMRLMTFPFSMDSNAHNR